MVKPCAILPLSVFWFSQKNETAQVLRMVGKDYIKGHWAAEARGFATNAWLVEHFMQKKLPEVAKHLMSMNWWPDMYMQKILSGLCIHVLPFEEMFDFLDRFMMQGFPWLVQFELAVVEHWGPKLLALKTPMDASSAFEMLKLDAKLVEPRDIQNIFRLAIANEEWVAAQLKDANLAVLRSEIFDAKLAKRLEKSQGEVFEPCDECEKAKPTLWCDTCDKKICVGCRDKKGHGQHKLESYE